MDTAILISEICTIVFMVAIIISFILLRRHINALEIKLKLLQERITAYVNSVEYLEHEHWVTNEDLNVIYNRLLEVENRSRRTYKRRNTSK